MGRPANSIERIIAKVSVSSETGCWHWNGKVGRNGYGHVAWGGKKRLAHRVFYEQMKGAIPEGLQIDHLCRNRACVNPEHLDAVTCRENNLRSPNTQISKNLAKTHCIHGHPLSGENLVILTKPNIRRQCRTCRREAVRRTLERKRRA